MEKRRIFSIEKPLEGYKEVIVYAPHIDDASGMSIYPVDIDGMQCNIHYSTKVLGTADADIPEKLLRVINMVLDDYNL